MIENTITVGGHRLTGTGHDMNMGSLGKQKLWRCLDCDQTATYASFDAGIAGCPMRPESLDYLSVSPGDDLGERAARQWLSYADRVGIKTTVWAEWSHRVGATGGYIADLQTAAGFYHIVVTRHGKLRAHNEVDDSGLPHLRPHNCPACAELADKGEMARPTL